MLSVSVLFVLSSPGVYNALLLSRNTQILFYTANWIHRLMTLTSKFNFYIVECLWL